MDKDIRKGFEKVKKVASKQEKRLIKEDKKLDKNCDARKMKDKK